MSGPSFLRPLRRSSPSEPEPNAELRRRMRWSCMASRWFTRCRRERIGSSC
jgi:hypothetical protein